MPQVPVTITATANTTYSDVQHKQGLLEFIDLDYVGIVAVVVSIEALLNPDAAEADWVWRERWTTASSNTDASYAPVKATTIQTGAAGSGEAHIPLRSPWRIKVVGATSGIVNAYISLDQG